MALGKFAQYFKDGVTIKRVVVMLYPVFPPYSSGPFFISGQAFFTSLLPSFTKTHSLFLILHYIPISSSAYHLHISLDIHNQHTPQKYEKGSNSTSILAKKKKKEYSLLGESFEHAHREMTGHSPTCFSSLRAKRKIRSLHKN